MEIDRDLPFETLLKLEQKLGSKTFREAHAINKTGIKKHKKKEQNSDDDEAPTEFSSKKPPKRAFVKRVPVPRKQRPIDPRFNPRAGTFKEKHFRKNFDFAFELKDKELAELKKKVKTSEDPEEKRKAKYLIQRMENQKREWQKRLNQPKPVVKDGKKYFPNKRETLAKDLVDKYEELKGSGKLQGHLEKRRKKQAGKERKKMQIEK
jgi:ribosomal RNA-processing protein 36